MRTLPINIKTFGFVERECVNGKKVKNVRELTKSPGNLCKSFGVNMSLYGEDLTGDQIFIEDRGMVVEPKDISYGKRVGVNNILEGSEQKLRFFLKI